MGYGNVAPPPVMRTVPCAARIAPDATASASTVYANRFMGLSPLEVHQRVDGDATLRRSRRRRREAFELELIDVEEQRRRDAALVREPVRDAGDRALPLLARDILVRLEAVEPHERFPAFRRPRRRPERPSAAARLRLGRRCVLVRRHPRVETR